MRVFQTTYKDRNRATRTARKWYVELRNAAGRVRRVPGFTDRRATEDFGRQLVRLVNAKGAGQIPDPASMQWLEGLPGHVQALLARQGFLNGRQSAGMKPLTEHLADYAAYLAAKGHTSEYVEKCRARVQRLLDACRFAFWSEIAASRVLAALNDLRADKKDDKDRVKPGMGAASFNHYLTAFKGFCRWMVKDGRAGESPVAYLDGLNARTDRRRDRRALALDEVRRLLTKTRGGPGQAGMSGPERATLYRLAVETGLRRGELASLTRASFDLAAVKPTVAVEAAYSKHRRRDVLPLRPDTAAKLQAFMAGKMPAAPASPCPIATG
jgi:site-specific recombinase XerC